MQRVLRMVLSQEKLLECINDLKKVEIVGIDTETSWERRETKLSLIQLCAEVGDLFIVWIIDCFQDLNLYVLQEFLASKTILKIMHHAQFDVNVLRKCVGLVCNNVWCTETAERHNGISKGLKLSDLADRHLGITMDKTLQQSNWGNRPLSREQLVYAALDAQILLDIYKSQIDKGFVDGLYGVKKDKKSKDLEKNFNNIVESLFELESNVRSDSIDWLKNFIESGDARNFQPSTFVLDDICLVYNIEEFASNLLENINYCNSHNTMNTINSVSCSIPIDYSDLLEKLHDFCTKAYLTYSNLECKSCKTILYDPVSKKEEICYFCRKL